MSQRAHDELVVDQFGPQAEAYVTSLVHAQGEDLEQLARAVAGQGIGRVLDLGCGGGHAGFTVAPHVREVVACDLSPDMLRAVEAEAVRRQMSNIVTQQAAAEHLPFADASFDAVVTRFSAHHWSDMTAGIAEAGRVVRPGGAGIFMDAASPDPAALDTFLQAVELLRDPSHVRDYTEAEWRDALGRAGFAVRNVTWRKLRMDFPVWIARMRTPALHAEAILALQKLAAAETRWHFALEPDGSFALDILALEAVRV